MKSLFPVFDFIHRHIHISTEQEWAAVANELDQFTEEEEIQIAIKGTDMLEMLYDKRIGGKP